MSEARTLSGTEGLKKIGELIKDIRICMLTTASEDGSFDSRPMATQKLDDKTGFDGTVWFVTQMDSLKVTEVGNDSHVGLMYADPSGESYVTAKGRATVSRDKAKIHELWSPMFKAWFPNGEDDPNIAVLRVDVHEAQYWESRGGKLVMGIRYLAAAITGGAVDVGETGKVRI